MTVGGSRATGVVVVLGPPLWIAQQIYDPANGALLSAVAMMAAGWDGAPADRNAPGFPNDGRWKVRFEGLRALP